MGTFFEWKIVVDQRRFTSGHRTVGEEEEDRNYHGGTRWRTSWRACYGCEVWLLKTEEKIKLLALEISKYHKINVSFKNS